MSNEPIVCIDTWFDFVCPFSYVQQPVYDEIRSRYAGAVEFRFRGFELSPEPLPSLNAQSEMLFARCAREVLPIAVERNVIFNVPKMIPRSRMALETVAAARSLELFDVVYKRIFKAYFVDGIDIGDATVLLELAASCGMDSSNLERVFRTGSMTESVLTDRRMAEKMGVSGVPCSIVSRAISTDLPLPVSPVVIQGSAPLEHFEAAFSRLLIKGFLPSVNN
jgi:predicted DsbA family dithiol-disulfide isomerase